MPLAWNSMQTLASYGHFSDQLDGPKRWTHLKSSALSSIMVSTFGSAFRGAPASNAAFGSGANNNLSQLPCGGANRLTGYAGGSGPCLSPVIRDRGVVDQAGVPSRALGLLLTIGSKFAGSFC